MIELLTLFYAFFKVGLFGFGGGYAMIPYMYENIQRFGFMSTDEFLNLLAISQITPGPIGLNAATYVGFATAGLPGAIIASVSVVLPSLIIIIIVAHFYDKYVNNKAIDGVLHGIRPVVIGLLAASVIFVGQSSLFKATFEISNILEYGYKYVNLIPLGIFLAVLLLNGKFKINPVILLVASGILGAFLL